MSKTNPNLKRCMDLMVILPLGPIIIAFVVLIAIFVRICCGRGVIFTQERAGLNGVPFTLYKFRTMKSDCDPFGPSPKGSHDSRLTGLGRYLRMLSLDELPQLFNVLKGNMSLVGPRPLYMEQVKEWNDRQKLRLLVKPGLTGLAQTSGRGSLTIEEKLELDVRYVENQNLRLDLKIIIKTFFGMLCPADIYEKKYSQTQNTRQS